jgi:hypothetical protein
MRFPILSKLFYRDMITFNFIFKLCLALHNIHCFESRDEENNSEIAQHCYFFEAVNVVQVFILLLFIN